MPAARSSSACLGESAPAIGERIRLAAPRDKLHLFSADGRKRLGD